jgi:branched-chain amino acid transport system substrate-binding protein
MQTATIHNESKRYCANVEVWVLAILLAGSAIFGGGCGERKTTGKNAANVKTIAIIAPLTGDVADLGKEILVSAELAVAEANARQTNGFSFLLSARDDMMSGATAATAAKGLIAQENTIAVVAAGISAVVKGTVEALNGQGVTVITPTATDSRLADGKDFVFRVIPPNSAQADALAKFAAAFPARKAALVFQQDDYSKDLKDAFAAAFKKLGGEITTEIGFEPDETDFRAHLDALKSSGAEMILCAAQHVPVARFLVRAREMGLQQPVLSGETAYTDKLLEVAGKATQGLFLIGPAVDLNNPDEHLKRYLDGYAMSAIAKRTST